jgi:hypothetical protein
LEYFERTFLAFFDFEAFLCTLLLFSKDEMCTDASFLVSILTHPVSGE